LHGAMRNVLELCRELTKKTFFLGLARDDNALRARFGDLSWCAEKISRNGRRI